jgi:zinc-binding alcohol dehydrogenase/oxidoreductase
VRAALVDNDTTHPALRVVDVPPPVPGWGEVLVELEKAALNRLDAMTLAERGLLGAPTILGSDGAGIVRQVGAGATGVDVGAHVVISPSLGWGTSAAAPGPAYEILGSPTSGTHAQFVVVPADNVFPKPDTLTWSEAAALPMAGLTAWRALVTRGRLAGGETAVVAAASSGVGSMAIQVAKGLGARVVAITSSPEGADAARTIGADDVVLRTSDDLTRDLVRATDGQADLGLDPTGALWQPILRSVKAGGRLVVVGRMAAETATLEVQTVYWKQVDILGSSMGSPADFAALLDHVSTARWKPLVDSEHPLEDIAAAYARLDAPDRVGKVVVDLRAPGTPSASPGAPR